MTSRSAAELAKSSDGPSLHHIPRFAEGILLVRCEGGDPGWSDPGGFYIIRDQTLLFVIEAEMGAWIDFLKQVNGERSIGEILKRTGREAGAVWKHLEEALEQRVLVVTSCEEPR